jgi:hypothetical protein
LANPLSNEWMIEQVAPVVLCNNLGECKAALQFFHSSFPG